MSQDIPIRHLPRSLQELPPRLARLCLQTETFMREDIAPAISSSCEPEQRPRTLSPCHSGQTAPAAFENRGILIACSGGCDSTALLLMLHCLAPRLGCRLAVAHLDHQLRPESAQEAEYVRALSNALGLPFIHAATNVASLAAARATGIEETARHARYNFLESARKESGCDYIATAHHLNDLAEDILMRLLRGTGWPALGGMDAFCPARRLIRPLLVTKRNKLEDFLSALSIPWCEDASNADPAYLRNRIRSTLLPLFLQENPAFLESAEGLWRLARTDSEHWSQQVDNILFSQDVMKNDRLFLTEVSGKDTSPGSSPGSSRAVPAQTREKTPCANPTSPAGSNSSGNSISSASCTGNASFTTSASPDGCANGPSSRQKTQTQSASGSTPSSIVLSKTDLKRASKALRLRLYKRSLELLGPGQPLLENLLRLDAAWLRNQGGCKVQFPGGKTATITRGSILFSRS